jgi:putative AdoMet-dependent methyltransferase
MPDLFQAKASNWDASQMRQQLSSAIGTTIVQQVPLNTEMLVMDFGAGTGLLTEAVAPQVSHVTVVDTSTAMLDKLMTKSALNGKVSAVCQDITVQPLETTFDLIISAMAMHHVENTDRLISTFSTHLRPGGHIALADLEKEDGTFHPANTEGVFHHGFERGDLQTILEGNGFVDVRFETAHTVDRDGKRFPVFLVIARMGR